MANEKFLLSDYLKYGVVKDFTATTREAAVAEAVNAMEAGMDIAGVTTANIGQNFSENELLSGESVETALIITMPTTVGNEANYLTGTKAPKITFGVNLYATQLQHEVDSFGKDYDADSTYPTIASDYTSLNAATSTGGNVTMGNDMSFTAGETNIYGGTVGLIQNGGVFDGAGNELDVQDTDYAVQTSGGTIKNLVIDKTGATRGIVINQSTEDVILDNVIIDGPGYALNTAEHGTGSLIVKNSTINGWTSFAGMDDASFTDTSFGINTDGYWQENGYSADYDRLIRPYITTVFTNCVFEKDFIVDLSALGAGCTVTFINCTSEGVVLTADNYSSYITIDGYDASKVIFAQPATTVAELEAALTDGYAVLGEDMTVSSTLTVAAGTEAVINLNGYDLNYAVDNNGTAAAIINNKGDLEITGEGTISFVAEDPDLNAIPAYATNTISNVGTLTIGEGVTVTNGSSGGASYAVDNHGIFYLNGGTLQGEACALRVAKYNQDNVQFVMNSGTITARTPAWIQLPGNDAAVAPNISVTINGGTLQSTKATSSDNNVMYTYSYGNSHANTSITINGGEFLGGTVSIGSGYKGNAPTLTINGGTFEYDVVQFLSDGYDVLYTANK